MQLDKNGPIVLFSITLLALVAGCSSARSQLQGELRAWGMPEREARCLSDELNDQLGKTEMKSITSVLKAGRQAGDARPSEVVSSLRQLDDRETVSIAVKATLGCAALNRL